MVPKYQLNFLTVKQLYLIIYLGLLCLVGGIIILIIFFVMKDTPEFADEMFWIFSGAELVILSLASVGCVGGFIQVNIHMKI